MRKHLSTIILIVVFLLGLSLLLYPTVSDWWNARHQSRVITDYTQQVAALDRDRTEQLRSEAEAYNRALTDRSGPLTEQERAAYTHLLDVSGTGIIGYLEIPAIQCALPIYHGTDEAVLQIAVGHVEGSSLPVGGPDTHCVLSGHRGLPSARLFTDLDKLTEGDTFRLRVLDETLTYQVDEIRVVEPQELDSLAIEAGQDYCTLVTCTPYGINSHRLLVRGRRAEEQTQVPRITADAMQIEPVTAAPLAAVPLLLLLLAGLLVGDRRRR